MRRSGIRAVAAVAVGALAALGVLTPRTTAPARADGSIPTGHLRGFDGGPSNGDAEPGIAAAPDGRLWATAVNIHDGPPDSQDVWTWTPTTGWAWVAAPFGLVPGARALGGNDADVAVATDKNVLGHYNVYVAGLWVAASPGGLLVGDISLAVSPDDGAHWVVHPLAGEFPGDDRPWVVADGACRVDLVYHAGPTVANIVNTYDLCDPVSTALGLTLTPIASTRYPGLAPSAAQDAPNTYVTAGFGKPVIHDHVLYIPAMDCPGLTLQQEVARAQSLNANCPPGVDAEVYVEVGTPAVAGGPPVNWTLDAVTPSDNSEVAVWPVTMAVDAAGTLYVAWHDNHHSFLSWSKDPASGWQKVQLNEDGTAVYPTVAADSTGLVRVAWYGTTVTGDANDQSVMGTPGDSSAAVWALEETTVSFAPRPTPDAPWPVVSDLETVESPVHYGALCTQGDACPSGGSRSLLDDFGMAPVPQQNADMTVFTSDQPGGGFGNDHVDWALIPQSS